MTHGQRLLVVLLSLTGTLGACSSGGTASPDAGDTPTIDANGGDPVLLSMAVTPASLELTVGDTATLAVEGTYDDDTTGPVTGGIWGSSAAAIATVTSAGLVTAQGAGSATLTFTAQGQSVDVPVTVTGNGSLRIVFGDDFGADISFAPFGGSAGGAVVDATVAHTGSSSLRVDVPTSGYTGGAFKIASPVDLSGFGAVTFWAKASTANALNVAGLGNDSLDTTYLAEWANIPLTTDWVQYTIPIPLPAKLTLTQGLFHFAEGAEATAYSFWLDDIRYVPLDAAIAATATPLMATEAASKQIGDSIAVNGTSVVYTIAGAMQQIAAARPYFTYASSDPLVATVDANGLVTAVAVGTAVITAKLGDLAAGGGLTVTVAPVSAPDAAPTAPTALATDVISLLSAVYTNHTVDTWRTDWSMANLTELTIGTDAVKKYTNLNYVGIEFYVGGAVDATTMTHFHFDVWTPDATVFRAKLVDFGANAAFGGGDDVEHEVVFDATSTPALTTGAWLSYDVPLASFVNLTTRAHLAQLIFSTSQLNTAYIDNVYFHK